MTLTLKTVTDLERIADMAVNISERAVDLSRFFSRAARHHPADGAAVGGMVRDAIDAFVARDVPKALVVIERDDGWTSTQRLPSSSRHHDRGHGGGGARYPYPVRGEVPRAHGDHLKPG